MTKLLFLHTDTQGRNKVGATINNKVMEKLTYFSNSKQIRELNISSAKEFGVFHMAMEIGSVFHRTNPVTKWEDRSQEKKLEFFSDMKCFGAITGDNLSDGFEQNNNPGFIYLTPGMQIDPQGKKLHFLNGNMLEEPKFNYDEALEVGEILAKYGYSFGKTNSVLVGS